jgi:hypothetical protein
MTTLGLPAVGNALHKTEGLWGFSPKSLCQNAQSGKVISHNGLGVASKNKLEALYRQDFTSRSAKFPRSCHNGTSRAHHGYED